MTTNVSVQWDIQANTVRLTLMNAKQCHAWMVGHVWIMWIATTVVVNRDSLVTIVELTLMTVPLNHARMEVWSLLMPFNIYQLSNLDILTHLIGSPSQDMRWIVSGLLGNPCVSEVWSKKTIGWPSILALQPFLIESYQWGCFIGL